MAGPFETIYDSFMDGAGLFMKKPAAMTLEFTKVAAIGLMVQVAFVFMMMGLGLMIAGSGSADAVMVVAVVIAALVAIAFFIVTTAVSATPYAIVDSMMRGGDGRIGIIGKSKALLQPVAGYCAIIVGLLLLVFGFALGGTLVSGGDALVSGILMLAALCFILVAVFLFQFALPKIALEGADAVSSLKASYALVRKDIWTVLLFDIVLIIALFAIILVLSVPQGIVEAQMSAEGADLTLVALFFAAYVIFSIIETVVVSLVSINAIYFFLRRAGGIPAEAAPATPSKKRSARR